MKRISLDITKAACFLQEGAVKAFEPKVKDAQKALEEGTCPGNDFLGWLHLPSSITKEFLAEVKQTADVLRCAVRTGFYRPGERLPPMRTLCRAAGVSMIVMNEVVARLAAEGLVNPRRGVGCTVLASDETLWKGRVLFVVPESDGSYFTNVLVGVVRETVMKAGWFFQQVTLGSDEKGVHDLSRLDVALRGSTDLALTLWERRDILEILVAAGIPFVTIADRPCPIAGAAGRVRDPHRAFASAFVRDCVRAVITGAMSADGISVSSCGPADGCFLRMVYLSDMIRGGI